MTIGDRAPDAAPGAPKKHPWGKWPKVDPSTIAPLRQGTPNMYDYVPTRFVTKTESEARGWQHFWTGEICVSGHRAARYISNPSTCVDCERVKKGKVPTYGKGVPELEAARKRNYTQKQTQHLQGPPQPNLAEKRFLEKYAELKDFAQAAEAVGRTESEFLAILSWNTLFRESVHRLEESLGVTRTASVTEDFDWDEDKRRIFLLTYANTADMKEALRSIRATNVQFHKELAQNPDFQRAFDEAAQIARSVFDHAASAVAIKGDSKLLGRIASNLFPEKFGENVKVDLNVKGNLTVEQSRAKLSALVSRFDRQGLLSSDDETSDDVVDAEYQLLEPARGGGSDEDTGEPSEDAGSDPNSDLVSGSD